MCHQCRSLCRCRWAVTNLSYFLLTTIMSESFEEVFDKWASLMEGELKAAYRVQAPCHARSSLSSSPTENNNQNQPSKRIFQSCPTELRVEICEWCYRVIDHCKIDRDVVGIALSYFDRYLSSQASMKQTSIKLAAMTCLYLAVKLHSTRKISISCMSSLSKGCFQVDQISSMEICIIIALRYHLNPPTPSVYLTVAIPLFETDSVGALANDAIELSRYLIELSVCDDYFLYMKPSCVACAAILVALDLLDIPRTRFLRYGLNYSPDATELCIDRLHQVYSVTSPQIEEENTTHLANVGPSPATVI